MSKLDWKKIVGSVAPTLATALGGPLAGVAVKTLAKQLLEKDNATEAEVADAIVNSDPQTLLRLREVELEFKKFIADAGIQLEKISADDRASARAREVSTHDSITPRVLAAVTVGGFLWCVYAVISGYVTELKDPTTATMIGTMIGYVSAKADQIISYYFGSSASSKGKDDTIATIAKME